MDETEKEKEKRGVERKQRIGGRTWTSADIFSEGAE